MSNENLNHATETQLREQIHILKQQLKASEAKCRRVGKELDQLRSTVAQPTEDVRQMMLSVETLIEDSNQGYEYAAQGVIELLRVLSKQYLEGSSMSFPVELVMTLMDFVIKAHQETGLELVQPGVQQWNAVSLNERVDYLRKVDRAALVVRIYWFLVRAANQFGDNPAILCYQVIRQCEKYGAPDMETLQRLKPWLDIHLPSYKIETLHGGLEIVQAKLSSGLNQQEFTTNHGPDERTFRYYQTWWNTIADNASILSDELKKLYSSIIDGKSETSSDCD